MRPLVILSLSFLLLAGCKRETSEAVAEAKGAAADAKRAADEAAAKAKAQAQAAADTARTAAADATTRVHEMGQAVQQGVNDATAQAKSGVETAGQTVQHGVNDAAAQAKAGANAAGQSIREVGEGNVVSGRLTASSAKELVVATPPSGAAVSVGADDRTRWISKGGIGAREGVPLSSSVRVTYIVRNGHKVATQVEQLP